MLLLVKIKSPKIDNLRFYLNMLEEKSKVNQSKRKEIIRKKEEISE